jgi:hypothetical protein
LSDTVDTFDDYRDDALPEHAGGLENIVEDFRDLAETKVEETETIIARTQENQ